MSDQTSAPPREIPVWLCETAQQGAPLVLRSLDTVAVVMSIYDFNALMLHLGVAAGNSEFTQSALRLARLLNSAPPEAAT